MKYSSMLLLSFALVGGTAYASTDGRTGGAAEGTTDHVAEGATDTAANGGFGVVGHGVAGQQGQCQNRKSLTHDANLNVGIIGRIVPHTKQPGNQARLSVVVSVD
ncbi:hypothetical protein [Pseudomonas sp. Pseusp97]|uniref:hypothetical protein n=1 Tax=Pseudomonas sp. Pseusp97 TaxID=3243065 RepID=UPI0039A5D4DF